MLRVCVCPSQVQFTRTSVTTIALANAAFLAGMGDDRQIPYNAVEESVHDTKLAMNNELSSSLFCASKED